MKRILVGVLLIIFIAVECYGQGHRSLPEGGNASGQAGAFKAQCDDPSAVTHNPAGLVQLEGNQVLLGATFITAPAEYSTNTISEDKECTPGLLPYFYYSTDFGKEKVRFGIGLSAPYANITEWDKKFIENYWGFLPTPPVSTSMVSYYSEMQTLNINPVVAYKFSPEFSAGIGLNVYYGKLLIKNLLSLSEPFPPSIIKGKIDVDGTGFAPNMGILYKKDRYSIGLTYRGALILTMKEILRYLLLTLHF